MDSASEALALQRGNLLPPPFFDQRDTGFNRVVSGRVDIGSLEVQGPMPTPTPRPSAIPRPDRLRTRDLLHNDSGLVHRLLRRR